MSESKLSSPSNRNLGHYKSLSSQPEILTSIHTLMELCIRMGILLDRWITVHQTQVAKKTRPFIHTSRPIDKIELELSSMICFIWAKYLPWYYDTKKEMNEAQKGNRRNRVILSTAANKC